MPPRHHSAPSHQGPMGTDLIGSDPGVPSYDSCRLLFSLFLPPVTQRVSLARTHNSRPGLAFQSQGTHTRACVCKQGRRGKETHPRRLGQNDTYLSPGHTDYLPLSPPTPLPPPPPAAAAPYTPLHDANGAGDQPHPLLLLQFLLELELLDQLHQDHEAALGENVVRRRRSRGTITFRGLLSVPPDVAALRQRARAPLRRLGTYGLLLGCLDVGGGR